MFDWLKEILGESYTEAIEKQVADKIGGLFVARSDYNSVNEQKKQLEQTLVTRDGQIAELRKVDPAKLEETITLLQADNQTLAVKNAEELKALRKESAVGMKLLELGAKAVEDIRPSIKLEGIIHSDDGTLTGLEEQVKALRESKSYLFHSAQSPKVDGFIPGESSGGAPPASKPIHEMSYSEIVQHMADNPDFKLT